MRQRCDGSYSRSLRRGRLDRLQRLPAGVELHDVFLGGIEFGGESIHLRGVLAEKFGIGEQAFDPRYLRFEGLEGDAPLFIERMAALSRAAATAARSFFST
jgi:hypothetical protein